MGKRSAQQMEIEFDRDEILKANAAAAVDKSLNQTTTTADITQVISTQAAKKQLVLAQDEDDADELFPEDDVAMAPQQSMQLKHNASFVPQVITEPQPMVSVSLVSKGLCRKLTSLSLRLCFSMGRSSA